MTYDPLPPGDFTEDHVPRVLIVDDDPMVRQQVRLVLRGTRAEIVGEAADGAAAVHKVKAVRPDIVLMDISMPGMSGIAATGAICALSTGARVIALTALGDDASLMQMLQAGAHGFVPKEYAGEDLATAVHRVSRGEGYVSPHSQHQLFGQLTRGPVDRARDDARSRLTALSTREHEVAQMVATGAKTAVIAKELFVSESTIKSQLDSIRAKLGVSSREEIAVLVERAGHQKREET